MAANIAHSKIDGRCRFPLQSGLGLIELMVSIAVSMTLMIVVVQVYAGSRQVYRATDELSELQEQGQLALDIIGYNIRMAGWIPVVQYGAEVARDADEQFIGYSGGKPPIEGCAGGPNCAAAAASGSDELTLRYAGDAYSSQTGAGIDCLGQNPYDVATNPYRIIQNRFFRNTRTVAVNGIKTTVGQLMCEGNGSPNQPQPLFQGVQQFQVHYGVDTNDDQVADTYKKADQIGASEWNQVVSARVCLLMQSVTKVGNSEQAHVDCAGNNKKPASGDRWIYRRFVGTYNLRNRVSETLVR